MHSPSFVKIILNPSEMKTTKSLSISADSLRSNLVYNLIFLLLIVLVGILASCEQPDVAPTNAPFKDVSTSATAVEPNVITMYSSLSMQTAWELQQARAAAARYRNIENARRDGYGDIDVVVENMGHHFMKVDHVDATFDMRKPEILVYNVNHDGSYELVAVEYAIPLDLSAEAPAGFTGDGDVWDHNDGFGLWLLHAWVYAYNPDGVFNPTNELVHLH